MLRKCSTLLFGWLLLAALATSAAGQPRGATPADDTRIILQLEDARSLGDGKLEALLQHPLVDVRYRAALALGRSGDKRATPALLKVLAAARTPRLRLITVFALGELEDAQAAPALLEVLQQKTETTAVRARAVEALGKIASLAPNAATLGAAQMTQIGQALIAQLPAPAATLTPAARQLGWLTITALMRVKPAAAVEPLIQQLKARDTALRANAANALARWGQALGASAPALIECLADRDIDVRANSARALGQSKAASAYEPLVKLLADPSDRVQVSAVRALASLADRRAVAPLLTFGEQLLKQYEQAKARGSHINLLLEIVPVLGGFKDPASAPFLQRLRAATGAGAYPEIETALLGLGESEFWQGLDAQSLALNDDGKAANLIAALGGMNSEQARAALAKITEQAAQGQLKARALAALFSVLNRARLACPPALARRALTAANPALRAQAANLLAEQNDENFAALTHALEQSTGATMTAARAGLLNAIAKYKTPAAVNLVKAALDDAAPRVQRRAAELLGQLGVPDVKLPAETVATRYTPADYARVRRLQNQRVLVTVYTSKGAVKAELFAREAPMTVDSFIELAQRDFFNGSPFHRVVPNFVAQVGSDPRNTGNAGGPGYVLRCEINLRLHQRGSLSMAHAGKDTGSSQFTFQHSPQPHLDGGYTVFGQVLTGMEVVDRLTRDDVIERIQVSVR